MSGTRNNSQDLPLQQRKLVTVLFADIIGRTVISQRLEPDEMLALTDGAVRRFNRIVERRGGRVSKFMGDGLMAVFGSPQVRDDDAKRAVRAGLEILASAKIYAQELEERWNLESFNVRVGAHTGLVIDGGLEEERSAVGRTVNLALRMESTAPSGGFRITQATYRQIRGLFEVDPQPLLKIKGKEEPLLTYLVKAPRSRSFRMDRPGVPGIKAPLIGRQVECEQLAGIYRRTVQARKANIITIVGDPGIGKSRLILEFENWLTKQPAVVYGFRGRGFRSLIDSPYSVLRMLIGHYCQIQDSDELEVVHQKLESHLSAFFTEDAVMKSHFIGALLGFRFNESRYLKGVIEAPQELHARAHHYLVQLFEKISGEGLTAILIEDIHWADDPTLNFVQELAKALVNIPLLIVCMARPELYDRRPGWPVPASDGEIHHTRLDLAPLSKQASHQLVGEILRKVDVLPDSLAETIVNQAEGNPYYIEELINMLIEDGVINRFADRESWGIDLSRLDETHVPDTITAVVLSRLGNLAHEERLFLQRASVAGRSFWRSLVRAISGKGLPGEVNQQAILRSLINNSLVYPVDQSTFSGEDEFVFKHTLLREAVYETILMGDRKVYHARVAGWLRSTSEKIGRGDEFAREIAEHYDLAKMPDPAADYYLRAGLQARNQGVPVEALRSLDRALELMQDEKSDRHWQAVLTKEYILGWLGRFEQQLSFSQSLVNSAYLSNADHLAEAYYRLGFAARSLGRYKDEAQAYKKALSAAEKIGNRTIKAKVSALLAHCLLRLGNLDQAEAVAREALRLVGNVQDGNVRARVITNVAGYYSDSGDVAKAIELFREAIAICSENNLRFGESVNRTNLGYNFILLGLPELALDSLEEATRLTDSIGACHIHAFSLLNLGLAYFRLGNPDLAGNNITRALADFESFGDRYGQGLAHLYFGLSLEQAGAQLAASDQFGQASTFFDEAETPANSVDAITGSARCRLLKGEPQLALQPVERVWKYLVANGSKAMAFPGLAYLTCFMVFEAIGQKELSISALSAGYADLMKRAEKIDDDAWRNAFLLNIPEHQALIERKNILE